MVMLQARWGTALHTSEAATAVLAECPDATELMLDFTGVEFVSRAFAEALLVGIAALRATGRAVEYQHLLPGIQAMLDTVKRTQAPTVRQWDNIQVLSFPSTKALFGHLQTL